MGTGGGGGMPQANRPQPQANRPAGKQATSMQGYGHAGKRQIGQQANRPQACQP